MTEPVPQRIGDAERDRAAGYLQEHLAQGRLSQDEFDERVGAALSARTADDLTPLFTDLPEPRPTSGQVAPAEPSWPAYQPPTGGSVPATNAPSAAAAPYTPTGDGPPRALLIVSAVAWPAWLLLMFAIGWQYWWLMFIPVIISTVVGKSYGDQGRRRIERHQDRYRRRELGD